MQTQQDHTQSCENISDKVCMTRAKIEHLLKVALWKHWKNSVFDNPDCAWRFMYLCGSNICSSAATLECLDVKKSDVPLWPKIIYYPPKLSREQWFDEPDFINGVLNDTTNDAADMPRDTADIHTDTHTDQDLHYARAVCILPMSGCMPVETYDFSPFELIYTCKYDLYTRFAVFCMINNRSVWNSKFRIPKEVLKMIWHFLKTTSNIGFKL